MAAVDFGRLKNQIQKRQVEQGFDIAFFPITRGRMRLALGLAAQGNGRYGHIVFLCVRSGAMTLTGPTVIAMMPAALSGE
ncbi:hypothetical protein NEIELOOT_00953 [Neisseria elongata subsp. glycolytica ATCC 29315]|uniref:Uncharacterized protein n=1 Tax=Neisseria elongata subsp. glycolytica ATCC 29315 TaxID=546263 RepID=D4DPG6_NEIEG|nr:hypothetical protein NEIELOOT_00953 [Neisseria elongata subsp. glycolytica ATCC 29315]